MKTARPFVLNNGDTGTGDPRVGKPADSRGMAGVQISFRRVILSHLKGSGTATRFKAPGCGNKRVPDFSSQERGPRPIFVGEGFLDAGVRYAVTSEILRSEIRMNRKSQAISESHPAPRSASGWVAALAVLALLIGAAPADAQGFSIIKPKTERAIGKKYDPLILKQMGYYADPFLQQYVSRIGRKIAGAINRKAYTYHFKVVDQHRENAMALPGGYIYITRGMLAVLNSEAELAGVLGHEIAHVTQRHGARQMTKALGAQFLTLAAAAGGALAGGGAIAPAITLTQAVMSNVLSGHGRAFEFEADEKGLYYAWKAGYDPRQASKFMRRLRQLERLRGIGYHGFGSTHPETALRILKLEELAQVLARPGQKLAVKGDHYKAQLSGLVYGERKEGYRLKAHRARAGETLPDLAAKYLGNRNFSLELALLNDLDDQAVLKEGQRIKIVRKK